MKHFGSYSPSLALMCRGCICPLRRRPEGTIPALIHRFTAKKRFEVHGQLVLLCVWGKKYSKLPEVSEIASVTTPPVLLLSAQSEFQIETMSLLHATAGHKLHRPIDGCGLV
jgi:hypothetical protein